MWAPSDPWPLSTLCICLLRSWFIYFYSFVCFCFVLLLLLFVWFLFFLLFYYMILCCSNILISKTVDHGSKLRNPPLKWKFYDTHKAVGKDSLEQGAPHLCPSNTQKQTHRRRNLVQIMSFFLSFFLLVVVFVHLVFLFLFVIIVINFSLLFFFL